MLLLNTEQMTPTFQWEDYGYDVIIPCSEPRKIMREENYSKSALRKQRLIWNSKIKKPDIVNVPKDDLRR